MTERGIHDRDDTPVLLLGATGLAGRAIGPALAEAGRRVVRASSRDADLRDMAHVRQLFSRIRPTTVVHAAGRVGGIEANLRDGLSLGLDNALITANVLSVALEQGVDRVVYLGSGCCYPNDRIDPMGTEDLFAGPVESSSRAYALSKSLGIELVLRARAEGRAWTAVIPANLYGPHDDYDTDRAHVVAATMRRLRDAKLGGVDEVVMWGTGSPRRQFLHSFDLGAAVAIVVSKDLPDAVVNVAGSAGTSIAELVEETASVVGFEGRLRWDTQRPDGTPVKLLDDGPVRAAGWCPRYGLAEGLAQTYGWLTVAIEAGEARGYPGSAATSSARRPPS